MKLSALNAPQFALAALTLAQLRDERHRLVVDAQHEVRAGDDPQHHAVELQRAFVLHRHGLDMEAVAVVLDPGGAVHALQRGDRFLREPQPSSEVINQPGVVAFHVDPQQLLVL